MKNPSRPHQNDDSKHVSGAARAVILLIATIMFLCCLVPGLLALNYFEGFTPLGGTMVLCFIPVGSYLAARGTMRFFYRLARTEKERESSATPDSERR